MRLGREAGDGLIAWFVAGDRAGSGPGRVWVAPGTACGRWGGGAVSSREEGPG